MQKLNCQVLREQNKVELLESDQNKLRPYYDNAHVDRLGPSWGLFCVDWRLQEALLAGLGERKQNVVWKRRQEIKRRRGGMAEYV
jgi:hypothetical protein